MCCVCEGSSLTVYNTYWYPHQWGNAVKRAISVGKETGIKQRVYLYTYMDGNKGWLLDSSRSQYRSQHS